jgi:hypothetical protein
MKKNPDRGKSICSTPVDHEMDFKALGIRTTSRKGEVFWYFNE